MVPDLHTEHSQGCNVFTALEDSKGVGYHSVIPEAPGAKSHPLTKKYGELVGDYVQQYLEAMEKVKLKLGLKIAMSISGEGNAYLQESKFWKLYKEDYHSCSVVMKTSAELVYLLACLLEPFMPSFTLEVLKRLNLPPETRVLLYDEKGDIERARRPWEFLPAGHKIGTPEPLFKELVSMMEKDFYLGRILTGRVSSGRIRIGDRVNGLRKTDSGVEKIEEGKNFPCQEVGRHNKPEVELNFRMIQTSRVQYIMLCTKWRQYAC